MSLLQSLTVPRQLRDPFSRDAHYVASHAVSQGLRISLGVQLCLAVGGSEEHAAWIHAADFVGLMLSMFYVRLGGSPARMLLWPGLLSVVAMAGAGMLFLAGDADPTLLATTLSISAGLAALGLPLVSTVYGKVYPFGQRGRMVSLSRMVQSVTALAALLLLGQLLGADRRWAIVLYPLAAAGMLFALVRFSRISLPPEEASSPGGPAARGPHPLKVLWRDREFAKYQFFQFVLGSANLAAIPMIAVYVRERLDLDVGLAVLVVAGGAVEQAAYLLSVRFHGALFDRLGVVRHRALASMVIAASYLCWMAADSVWVAALAVALAGFGRSGGSVLWSIGSLSFAPKGAESAYSAIHTSLTGVRGVLAPLAGLWVLRHLLDYDYTLLFGGVAGLVVFSALGHGMLVRVPTPAPQPAVCKT